MSINELQQELCEKLANVIMKGNDATKNDARNRVLEIINELKDHINDVVEHNGWSGTVLDHLIFNIMIFDSQDNQPLVKQVHDEKTLEEAQAVTEGYLGVFEASLEIEDAIKKIGGKASTKNLQKALAEIISCLSVASDDQAIDDMKQKWANKIIDELKDHINDIIECNGFGGTALDYAIFFNCRDFYADERLNNPVLEQLEAKIKNLGGEMSGLKRELTDNEESEGEYITSDDEDIIIDHLAGGINTLLENPSNQQPVQSPQNRRH